MEETTALFTVEPIPAVYLDRLRAVGQDEAGNPLRRFTAGTEGGPLQSRNVGYGCYMFTVRRAGPEARSSRWPGARTPGER